MKTLPTPADLADYIAYHGHARGSYYGVDGSVCVLGAFRELIDDERHWVMDSWTSIGLVELAEHAGYPVDDDNHAKVTKWSDSTPTGELLRQLREGK